MGRDFWFEKKKKSRCFKILEWIPTELALPVFPSFSSWFTIFSSPLLSSCWLLCSKSKIIDQSLLHSICRRHHHALLSLRPHNILKALFLNHISEESILKFLFSQILTQETKSTVEMFKKCKAADGFLSIHYSVRRRMMMTLAFCNPPLLFFFSANQTSCSKKKCLLNGHKSFCQWTIWFFSELKWKYEKYISYIFSSFLSHFLVAKAGIFSRWTFPSCSHILYVSFDAKWHLKWNFPSRVRFICEENIQVYFWNLLLANGKCLA